MPGNLIYQSVIWVDSEDQDDQTPVVVQSVDPIENRDQDVTYILTAQETVEGASLFVYGPITFTAAEIKQ